MCEKICRFAENYSLKINFGYVICRCFREKIKLRPIKKETGRFMAAFSVMLWMDY